MRFTEPETPYISVGGDSNKYVIVDEGSERAIKSDGIYLPSLISGLVIGIIVISIISWSVVTIISNKEMQMSDDLCPGAWGDLIELGDGTSFCTAEDWSYFEELDIKQIQSAENHYKITYDDWTTEYRWEASDHKQGLVIVGAFYEDGFKSCQFFFIENELPDNFGTNDLFLGDNSLYPEPSWCNDNSDSEEIEYSADVSHPFLGEKMYHPMYNGYADELGYEVTTNSSTEQMYYPSTELVEAVIEEEIIIASLMFLASLIIALYVDRRRFVLKFDVEGKRMSLRRSMTSTRLGGWSWRDVNYSSAELIQQQDSVSLMMTIKGQKRLIADFDGEQAHRYIEPLKKLLNIRDTQDPEFTASEVFVNETQIVEYQGLNSKEEPDDELPKSGQLDAFWNSNDFEKK